MNRLLAGYVENGRDLIWTVSRRVGAPLDGVVRDRIRYGAEADM